MIWHLLLLNNIIHWLCNWIIDLRSCLPQIVCSWMNVFNGIDLRLIWLWKGGRSTRTFSVVHSQTASNGSQFDCCSSNMARGRDWAHLNCHLESNHVIERLPNDGVGVWDTHIFFIFCLIWQRTRWKGPVENACQTTENQPAICHKVDQVLFGSNRGRNEDTTRTAPNIITFASDFIHSWISRMMKETTVKSVHSVTHFKQWTKAANEIFSVGRFGWEKQHIFVPLSSFWNSIHNHVTNGLIIAMMYSLENSK